MAHELRMIFTFFKWVEKHIKNIILWLVKIIRNSHFIVHKQFNRDTDVLVFLHIVHGRFCAAASESSSCDRARGAAKPTVLTARPFAKNVCWPLPDSLKTFLFTLPFSEKNMSIYRLLMFILEIWFPHLTIYSFDFNTTSICWVPAMNLAVFLFLVLQQWMKQTKIPVLGGFIFEHGRGRQTHTMCTMSHGAMCCVKSKTKKRATRDGSGLF